MFSYTKPRADQGYIDGSTQICWENAWTLTELAPTEAGSIRLRVALSTYSFWTYPASYVAYAEDRADCGAESVVLRESGGAGYSYDKVVSLPASWAGRDVRFRIGWADVTLRLDVLPALPSEITAADGEFGSALGVLLTRHLEGVTHDLSVSCAGRTETLLQGSAELSCTWTPALAVYAPLITDSGTAQAVFTAETFFGGASLGTTACTVTLSFPASLAPALSPGWAALHAYNTGAAAPFSCYIAGMSRAEAVFDAAKVDCSGLCGATLAGFYLRCGGETVSAAPYRSGVLSGETALICGVRDSRGHCSEQRFTLVPESYAPPALSAVSVLRCDAQGTPDENGSAVSVSASLELSSLGGENSGAVYAAARMPPGDFGAEQAVPCVLGGLSPDRSVQIRLRGADAMGGEVTAQRTLPTRRWAMKFRPDGLGVAFGKAPESGQALELPQDWELLFGSAAWWERVYPVGAIALGAQPPVGVWEELSGGLAGERAWRRTS